MRLILSVLFVNSTLFCFSQNRNIIGVFPTIDHSASLSQKLDYGVYIFGAFPLFELNSLNHSNDLYFHLFYSEIALTFNKSKQLSFTGSYLYQRENVLKSSSINENRFYLQSKYKHSIGRLNLAHRLRFDGRFIQNKSTGKFPFSHRIRYLIGLDYDLNSKSYLTSYEELFFNTLKNANPIYNENWFYAAYGRKLNERNKIETGLLFVTWNIGNKNWYNQYYFQLTWINRLNFIK